VLELDRPGEPQMTLVMRPANTRIAVAVDAVDDVFDTPLAAVRPAPSSDADGAVLGVVWRGAELVTLLDADVIVNTCLVTAPPDSL
jgi:chemotaxis signal transduction protein